MQFSVILWRSILQANSWRNWEPELEAYWKMYDCLTKAEEPSLPYYLPIAGGRIFWIHTFPKGISAMWNAISQVQDLNSCRRVHILRR